MDDSNKIEFAKVFYAMGEYYDKKVSTDLLLMLFSDLSEFTIDQVKSGAKSHRLDPKYGTFFPTAAGIIRHLKTGNISTEEKSQLAWAQIEREIRVTGAYGALKLDDKQALAALKSIISWKDLCGADTDRITWIRKEFMSMYSTYENTPLDMLPSSLPGLVELRDHKEKGMTCIADVMKGIQQNKLNKEE